VGYVVSEDTRIWVDQTSGKKVPWNRLGNMRSIDHVIAEQGQRVTAYVRSMVRDQSLVEDLVQETFIRVWRYMPTYRGEGSFESWILSISHNVVMSAMAKKIDIPTETLHTLPVEDAHNDLDFVALISRLPIEQRRTVTLCLVLGYSYQDAADVMGVPIGTVRSRIARGRETLREILTSQEDILPLAQ